MSLSSTSSLIAALLIGVAVTLATASPLRAQAEQRFVVINGELLSTEQLFVLDRLAGGYVPNGAYWVDTNTGIWGYAGDPMPRGRIGGGVDGGAGGGSNYSGALDRGPFGTYMSDGNCSFVNGVPVGNC